METKQASSQSFCLCSHARSMHGGGRCALCQCAGFLFSPKNSRAAKRLTIVAVEPSPNARARDAAVLLIRAAMETFSETDQNRHLNAALVCLEAVL